MATLGPFLGARQAQNLQTHGAQTGFPGTGRPWERWFWVEFRSGYGMAAPSLRLQLPGAGGRWHAPPPAVRLQVLGRPLHIVTLGPPRLACRPASALTRKGPRGRAGADSEAPVSS